MTTPKKELRGRFAAATRVPVEQSRAEIERVLNRYGASGFGYAWNRDPGGDDRAVLTFSLRERQVRLEVGMPADPAAARQRWRAVLLVIKAKLEAVESGIGTLESEFLADIVLRDGRTIGQAMLPRLSDVVETGRLLPAIGETERRTRG